MYFSSVPPSPTRARRVAVVTGSRADYGYLHSVLRGLANHSELELQLLVTGMHLSAHYGKTVDQIEKDGFKPADKIHTLLAADTPQAVAQSVGLGVMGFSKAYERLAPDVVVLFGDRFEMFAAAVAAIPFRIPLAHIGGGENTVAVTIDVTYRAALTKMSHLHFVSIEPYRQKLLHMGEEDWRIHVVGSSTIDYMLSLSPLSAAALGKELNVDFTRPVAVVTYHPVTMEDGSALELQMEALLEALAGFPDLQQVITFPNADTDNSLIVQHWKAYERQRPNVRLVENLGSSRYLSLLRHASVMVGNSSSGILEAATFQLPVVNIGDRQADRVRPENVLDVGYDSAEIRRAIERSLTDETFKLRVAKVKNPYGDGRSGERIVNILARTPLDRKLLRKELAVPHTTLS